MRFECRIGLSTEGYASQGAFPGRRFMRDSSIFTMAGLMYIRFDLGREPKQALDRMARSAVSRMFQAEHPWCAPRRLLSLRLAA